MPANIKAKYRTVAAVNAEAGPSTASVSAVLEREYGDDNSSDSSECVPSHLPSRSTSPNSPFQTPHLMFLCSVDGPSVPSPLRIKSLIDTGSHLVLIDDALVTHLGLRRRTLLEPISISLAMDTTAAAAPTRLSHWVKLRPQSLDNSWTSCSIRAVIAPGLCYPLILGGPFLVRNKIVVDHKAHTCIDKDTKYNVLRDTPLSPPPTRKSPRRFTPKSAKINQIRVMMNAKSRCLQDLQDSTVHQRESLNSSASVSSTILQTVTAIRD